MDDPVVQGLAKKYQKTAAQILLRHAVQQGLVVIPKSVKQHRVKENFALFDFSLSPEDILALDNLDKGVKGRAFNICEDFFKTEDDVTKLPENPYTGVDDY